MARQVYLTIDDSPSPVSDDLINYLAARNIPALIFCRGDYLEANPAPMRRAIEHGFIIGNHLYSHQRASRLEYEQICTEIQRTERLIEQLYKDVNTAQPMKTIRFPYLDRGMGAWFVEPDNIKDGDVKAIYTDLIQNGLGNDHKSTPSIAQIETKNRIQENLRHEGYAPPAFAACTAPWYRDNIDIKSAHDTLITCSSSDWMLTARHKGKWPWDSVPALADRMLARMDADDGAHIILLHDQAELMDSFKAFIDLLINAQTQFLNIA